MTTYGTFDIDSVPCPHDCEFEQASREQKSFDELSEKEQTVYYDKATELLADLLWCTRVWEAWQVGTMTEDDFIKADEDDEILDGAARSLYNFVQERKSQ